MKYIQAFTLYCRVKAFSFYLRSKGIYCTINAHYRDKRNAHRWSTAYSIISGRITMGDLRALENGCDQDGNRWYHPDWDTGGRDDQPTDKNAAVKDNALALYGPDKIVFAAEGYERDEYRRKPNNPDIPVSKHVYGTAIDINVHWNQIGGPWSEEACKLMDDFGLLRPVPSECWHIELNRQTRPKYALFDILRFWIRSKRLARNGSSAFKKCNFGPPKHTDNNE